ncbi:MAG TPA: DUF1566 domain-containing protein [Smithellaceae bacterium]|nr:DUF1566 domain-containing protein [Smithella sp.]HPN86351.1 DUF1566 domain-containing protein [Smithella sp.]HQP23975.1 DUF1566 domain-containing protein [Smithellaceae bacterium]
MRSKFTFKKMTLLVLTLLLLFALAACGGGQNVKSDPAAKDKADDGRFIANDNGTVLDTQTNLMWAAKDNGSDISFTSAKAYCDNYRGGGYSDWRIPTLGELMGLFDGKKSRPAACDRRFNIHVATELINISCVASWASEIRGSDAAYLSFGSGRRYWGPQSSEVSTRILPVRSNK